MVLNITGGVLAAIAYGVLVWLGRWIISSCYQRRFRQFFGEDIMCETDFYLVYTSFMLDESILDECKLPRDRNGRVTKRFYLKQGKPDVRISIEKPISSCEIRATKYLAEVIGAKVRRTPTLSTDYKLADVFGISFVALGSHNSNSKTEDTLRNRGNKFVEFPYKGFLEDVDRWFVDKNGRRIPGDIEPGFDYGLIMKIHPTQDLERTWFVCAGYGEWGTSGAAQYLAHRWKKIYDDAKAEPFAIIVKVPLYKDQLAEPLAHCYGGGPWCLAST